MSIPVNDGATSTSAGGFGYRSNPDLSQAKALNSVGQDLSQAGESLAHLSTSMVEREQKAKAVDDHRWATEAYLGAKDSLAEQKAKLVADKSENIAQELKNHAKTILDMIPSAGAPSGKAYQLFKNNFNSFASTEVANSYDIGYANKVSNTVNSVRGQISTVINTYRKDKDINSLLDSVAAVKAFTSNSFDTFSPEKSTMLKADLMTETVLAVMNNDPKAANAILKSDNSIDEQLRHRLQEEVNQASRVKNSAELFQFQTAVKNALTSAEAGNITKNPYDDQHYTAFYGDTGAAHKAADDFEFDVYSGGNAILKKVEAYAPEYQKQVLTSLSDKTKWTGDNAMYLKALHSFVGEQITANLRMQEQDPAGWLQQYNPHIRQATQQVHDAHDLLQTSPQDPALQGAVTAKIKELNDTQLRFQGSAPEGSSIEESKMYLNRPQNEYTLLPTKFAEKQGDELNSSKPKEFLKKTSELLAQYPDDKQRMIVFNDLVTKGKLSQQYQMAWLNKDAWWVDTYLGFVSAGKDIKLPEVTTKEIDDNITANKNWLNLRTTMIGDNNQRSHELAGFYDSIKQFSVGLVASGKSPKDAVNLATDKLVNTELGFTKVNGKPLMILRARDDGKPARTDNELKLLGDSLSFALQQIPIKTIDQKPFVALSGVGSDDARLKHLDDEIQARAFWQTGNDGKSAVLYAVDENNFQPFQVRDKLGKPFVAHFDDLPVANIQYNATPSAPGATGGYINYGAAKADFDYFGQRVKRGNNQTEERPTWLKVE